MYSDEEHGKWKAAADRKGQTLREWVRRSLLKVADEEEAEDDRRRGRSR